MTISWSKQAYVQGFDCKSITFNKSVNMLEQMQIVESVYEGVLIPSDKKPTKAGASRAGQSRQNIVETASSHTYSAMSESNGKRRKICVDRLTDELKV